MALARIRTLRFAPIALALALAPAGALAQTAEWNQERVTKIAEDFNKKAGAAYDQFYKTQVNYTIGSGQAKDYQRMKDKVRVIRTESRRLASQLKKGKGRDETLPIYERMMGDVRDVREIGKRIFIGDDVLNAFGAAGDALRQLSPYYTSEPAPTPEAPKPAPAEG